jgi:hypothetical protein
MSTLSKASAFVLFALFAACGGSAGTGAGAGSSAVCDTYCQGVATCANPSTCVLSDPSAFATACKKNCEAGFAMLPNADAAAVTECLSCMASAAGGKCVTTLPSGTCGAQCDTASSADAFNAWASAFASAPITSASACTNGNNLFAYGDCGSSVGGSGSCGVSCCVSPPCSTPDVAATCTGPNESMCTCTAGKNTGKTFTSSTGCAFEPWNECNL